MVVKEVLLYTETWGHGGIEAFALDEIEAFSAEPVSFTVFAVRKQDSVLDDRLTDLGVQTIFCFEREDPSLAVRCLVGWKRFDSLLRSHCFDVVHVNTMNGAGLMYARIAKRHGVPVVVAHSRNSRYGDGYAWAKELAHRSVKALAGDAADVRLACSEDAGRYLFDNRSFEIVRRGLDTGKYAFDPRVRHDVRERLGIDSHAFLVGNIGRVSAAKDPLFQVEVLSEFYRRHPDSRFLLVGDGPLRTERDAKVVELGLGDVVISLDATHDVAPYYSALDCLIMPSRYEGLPNVAVEAQCAGLPIVISDAVSDEVRITDLVQTCPLAAGAPGWAQAIEAICMQPSSDRSSYESEMVKQGFSTENLLHRMKGYYGLEGARANSG